MQIIKPLNLSLLHRSMYLDGRYQLCVSPIIWFSLNDSSLISEQQGWKKTLKCLADGQVLDAGAPKGVAEVICSAKAYAPDGNPVESMQVSVALGELFHKEAWVVGDQYLSVTKEGIIRSPITPFEEKELSWERSFGGMGLDENLQGTCCIKILDELSVGKNIVLPNLRRSIQEFEHNKPVQPVAFGPMPIGSPIIQARAGSYDQDWLKHHYPGLAPDHHPGVYNMAQEDQWLELGGVVGDESFALQGLAPYAEPLVGQLPGLRARAFIQRHGAPSDQIERVETNIDTVWFFPEQGMGVLVYRGLADIADSDALDIDSIMVASERLRDAPRPIEYYANVHALRTNKATALNHVFNHSQLMPEKTEEELAELAEEHARAQRDTASKLDLSKAAIKQKIQQAKEDNGDDTPLPDEPSIKPALTVLAPEAIARGDVDLTELLESAKQLIEEKKQEAEKAQERLKQELESNNLTNSGSQEAPICLDDIVSELEQRFTPLAAIPEANIGAEERETLHQQAIMARLASTSDTTKANLFDIDVQQYLRKRLIRRLGNGESLAGLDFSGADLSGLDLSKRDLSKSQFESAVLDGCDFTGSKLDKSVLTNASMSEAIFDCASMQKANLSGVKVRLASFKKADLSEVVAVKAELTHCDFTAATLNKTLLTESQLSNSRFTDGNLSNARFVKCIVSNAHFNEAQIYQCLFIEADGNDIDWRSAALTRTIIAQADLKGADFSQARFDRVQFGGDIDLSEANFVNARGATLGLLGCDLRKSNLDHALFKNSNFSGAAFDHSSMQQAGFFQCLFSGAQFKQVNAPSTNFAESLLRKSMWVESNLERAEFYGANAKESKFQTCALKYVKNFPTMVEVLS